MAGEIQITVIGNLTADAELRFTPAGKAVANFTVASTPRFMREGQWVDGEAVFMRCAIWGTPAENVVESAFRGTRVIVTGRLKQRSYETKEGEKRTVVEMDVDELGLSTKFKSVSANNVTRSSGGGSGAPADDDPWGQPPKSSGASFNDEPPF